MTSEPPRCRNASGNALDEITVGVDQRKTVAALQVLERHVFQERRFSRAGLADDVEVQETVFVLNPEHPLVAVKINAGEPRDVIRSHTGAPSCYRPFIRARRGILPNLRQSPNLTVAAIFAGTLRRLRSCASGQSKGTYRTPDCGICQLIFLTCSLVTQLKQVMVNRGW